MTIRKNITFFFLLFASFAVFGQNEHDVSEIDKKFDSKENIVPFVLLDESPRFKNCKQKDATELKKCFEDCLDKYINNELVYPELYKKDSVTAKVYVNFKIDRKGNVFEIKTRSNLKEKDLFEKEVIRLISDLPNLKAGIYKGEKVITTYSKVVIFSLKSA